ncbi:LD-carboxypeptidase [Pigmentibacter sp. JX0631]|uniref:LD-carboxypeptidase n=1 Tax=Pigmentibacter sp. JX0631 TaxID=2976982 RepID=UPI002468BE55|nr:LD-carboxypeptidase [Pigmentibacter sp. JX0631]WGL58901.1 LD-carboxypeptidase [Pigmentibacter sp. JX0631]
MLSFNKSLICLSLFININIYANYYNEKTAAEKLLNEFNTNFYQNAFENLKKIKVNAISPSSPLETEKLLELKKFNFLYFNKNLNFNSSIPYLASTDLERFNEIKEAINNENKIIWATRGGYGSSRLFPFLKKLEKSKNRKIFIGYSDVTFLHLFFNQNWNWITIHGSTLGELLENSKDKKNFILLDKLINCKKGELSYSNIKLENNLARNSNILKGLTTGGNLEIILSSIGTQWQIKTDDKIVFLEETNVKGYSLDRAFTHLLQSNIFKNAKAIVLGEFIGNDDSVNFALKRFTEEVQIPVFKLDTFGHGKKNYPILLNTLATIDSKLNKITFEFDKSYFIFTDSAKQYAQRD